jgi:hypothetical protein
MLLRLLAARSRFAALSTDAAALSWPVRPAKIILPYAPGAEAAVKSARDGCTPLLIPNSAIGFVAGLRKAACVAQKPLDEVGRAGNIVGGFVVLPLVGLSTMQELIAYARKSLGKLSLASLVRQAGAEY